MFLCTSLVNFLACYKCMALSHALRPSLILDTSFLHVNPFVSLVMSTGTTVVFLLAVFMFASDESPKGPVGLTGPFAALAVGITAKSVYSH